MQNKYKISVDVTCEFDMITTSKRHTLLKENIMKTLNYAGDVAKSPKTAMNKMKEDGSTFITWRNSFTNTRFVATLNYVSVMASNKKVSWRDAEELPKNEIKNLGVDLCTDEVLFEMMAHNTTEIEIKEGFGVASKISIDDLNVCENVAKAGEDIASKKENKMTNLTEIKNKAIELGGEEWVKGEMERVYISCEILNKLTSMGVNYGERNNKIFLDAKTGKIMRSYKGKKPSVEFDLTK